MKKLILMLGCIGVLCIAANGLHEPIHVEVTLPAPAEIMDSAAEAADYIAEQFSGKQAPSDTAQPNAAEEILYRIRNAANEAASQLGAYCDLAAAEAACPRGYCVFDAQGKVLYRGA